MASQHMAIGSFKDAQKVIKKYDSIIIFHHTRPDGDCLGSQFGLRLTSDTQVYPCSVPYFLEITSTFFATMKAA